MDNNAILDKLLRKIEQKFSVEFEPLGIDGRSLEILSINNMPSYLDRLVAAGSIGDPLRDLPLWAKVWPSSFVLAKFLKRFVGQGKSTLELGAGMGVCSLIAANYGLDNITATDISGDALDFARANVLKNGLDSRIDIKALDVASPRTDPRFAAGFDIIVASELLYLDDLHRPIIKFLQRHLSPTGVAVFCSDISRAKPRFKKLAEKNFSVREGKVGVKSSNEDGEEERRAYNLLILENS